MKYLGTTFGCVLLLLLTVPRYGGFLLVFFAIFLIPLFLYSGIRMYRYKSERKIRARKLAAWISAMFVSLAVNYYRYSYTRNLANDVVADITKYREINGGYPDSLEVLGYQSNSLKPNFGFYGYQIKDGQPSFMYSVPYMVFDVYRYDFHSKIWEYSDY